MWLYLARLFTLDGSESFLKLGVTQYDAQSRLGFGTTKVVDSNLPLGEKLRMVMVDKTKYIPNLPYEFQVLHQVHYLLEGDARAAEQELLSRLRQFQVWPEHTFSGRSECFSGEVASDAIIQDMNRDCASRNDAAPSALVYRLHAVGVREADPIKRHMLILSKCRGAGVGQ